MSVCILCLRPALKYTKSRVSLHKFPVCPRKRQIWLKRCRLTDEKILPHHKICSLHFKRSCFKFGVMRRKLYSNAEPTIFKNGHVKISNTPIKNLEVNTRKSSKTSQHCILCKKFEFIYPSPMKSFHRFPVCPKKRQIWLNWCGLTNEEVLPNHKICSLHFKQSCFKSGVMRRRLYPDAKPTIFKKGHAKITNMPPKNVKGTPKNCNKKGIAIQHHQSRDVLKTVNAVEKRISSQMLESSDISQKKVIFGKNRLSHKISPTKAVKKSMSHQEREFCDILKTKVSKEVIADQDSQSCDDSPTESVHKAISSQNIESCEITSTRAVKKRIALQKHKSCDISQAKVCKVVASQNSQSRDVSSTKSVQKEISSKNRESCDIALTRTVKRRIARQKRKSCDISQTKLSKEVIVDQNNQSCNVLPTKSVLKGIPGQKHESRDVSPTKSVQNKISDQKCESCDNDAASSRAFVEEVVKRTSIILSHQKKELDELDLTIEDLKKKKAILISQLKVLNNRFSRHNTKK